MNHAAELAKIRWGKTSKEKRVAHSRMMNRAKALKNKAKQAVDKVRLRKEKKSSNIKGLKVEPKQNGLYAK